MRAKKEERSTTPDRWSYVRFVFFVLGMVNRGVCLFICEKGKEKEIFIFQPMLQRQLALHLQNYPKPLSIPAPAFALPSHVSYYHFHPGVTYPFFLREEKWLPIFQHRRKLVITVDVNDRHSLKCDFNIGSLAHVLTPVDGQLVKH